MIIILEEEVANIELTEETVMVIETYDFDLPSGITVSEFAAKGDILVGTGSREFTAFPAGVDGTFLKYDSSKPGGVTAEVPSLPLGDGWTRDYNTWAVSSLDSPTGVFSVNADMSAKIQKGMRLKYQQAQALTYYWTFDTDSAGSVGSPTMTNIGAPTYTPGKYGNALTLNGTNQALAVTDAANLKPTGEFTIGCWFKTSTTGAYQALFYSYSQNSNFAGIGLIVRGDTNTLAFVCGNNTGTVTNINNTIVIGKTVVTDGNLHYVCVAFRNKHAQLYLDGNLESSGYCLSPSYAATNYVRIGCQNNSGTNLNFFNGQIDDLFLINGYALDEETIRTKHRADTAQGVDDITVTKCAIVTAAGAWSGLAQLITVYHGTDYMLANTAISNVHYSHVKVPLGFNINPDKWSVLYANNTDVVIATPAPSTDVITSITISAPIGIWDTKIKGQLEGILPSAATLGVKVKLGSSVSNLYSDLIASGEIGSNVTIYGFPFERNSVLNITAKTNLFYYVYTAQSLTSITIRGSRETTSICLTSAYI